MVLRTVTSEDYKFLYQLLLEKTPMQNISHKELPAWEKHVAFNQAIPYQADYIIVHEGQDTGRIYLTKQDEVGIHIRKAYAGKGIGGQALELLITMTNRPLLANIAPSNTASQAFFIKHGFRLVQYTYQRD